MLFQNSISSDQMLPLQLLSVYKPLLVDKPGSQELFSSQFLMKNSKKKSPQNACAFKDYPLYYYVFLKTLFPVLFCFSSCPFLDSNLYLEPLGATAVKITGNQYLMVGKMLWWLLITYYSGIWFMNICWFTLESLLMMFDEATIC